MRTPIVGMCMHGYGFPKLGNAVTAPSPCMPPSGVYDVGLCAGGLPHPAAAPPGSAGSEGGRVPAGPGVHTRRRMGAEQSGAGWGLCLASIKYDPDLCSQGLATGEGKQDQHAVVARSISRLVCSGATQRGSNSAKADSSKES